MSLPPVHPPLPKPALSALEEKAAILLALFAYYKQDTSGSKVILDAWDTVLRDFVEFEANYLGLEPNYLGAHDRAEEYTKGI